MKSQELSRGTAEKRRKRVLVVEDDEAVAMFLADCLESAGYAALTAGGARGLASIPANPPDLILLDMLMPGGVISKPFDVEHVLTAVDGIIGPRC